MSYKGAFIAQAIGGGGGFGGGLPGFASALAQAAERDMQENERKNAGLRDWNRTLASVIASDMQTAPDGVAVPEGSEVVGRLQGPDGPLSVMRRMPQPESPDPQWSPETDTVARREQWLQQNGLGRYWDGTGEAPRAAPGRLRGPGADVSAAPAASRLGDQPSSAVEVPGLADARAQEAAMRAIESFGGVEEAIEAYNQHARITTQAPDDQRTLRELLRLRAQAGRRELLSADRDESADAPRFDYSNY